MGSANVDVDRWEGNCLVGDRIDGGDDDDDNHAEDEDAAPDHRRRDGRKLSANAYNRGCALPLAVAVAVVAMTTVDLIAMNVVAVAVAVKSRVRLLRPKAFMRAVCRATQPLLVTVTHNYCMSLLLAILSRDGTVQWI